jgi:uncharacterized protein with von Willebrand factor type A (vWA) domain
VIFIGDATMSPYEVVWPGGSVEHHNPETGSVWMGRILDQFRKVVWLNPAPQEEWRYAESVQIIDQLVKGQMYPLNMGGIDRAISYLSK